MKKDSSWKSFFSDDERFADCLNGFGFGGRQVLTGSDLQEMLDFTGIPESLRGMVQDHRINLIEIRKLTDTSMFKTDLRQVFDFIRCSHDKKH